MTARKAFRLSWRTRSGEAHSVLFDRRESAELARVAQMVIGMPEGTVDEVEEDAP